MKWLALGLTLSLLAACSGPLGGIPGGRLEGVEVPLEPGSIPADITVLQLETNPAEPYSVNIGFVRVDGQLYIDPAPERRWYENLEANPRVRVRFDGQQAVHPRRSVRSCARCGPTKPCPNFPLAV